MRSRLIFAFLLPLGVFAALMMAAFRPTSALVDVHHDDGSDLSRKTLPVLVAGTAAGEVRDISHISDAPGAEEALCFDVDLIDLKTGRIIGTATDCLMNVQEHDDCGGLSLTDVTFFHFPQGTIIAEGEVTVQPVTIGSPSATHITGAVPDHDENNILMGTRAFRNAEGNVRLAGAVDMSRFAGEGIVTFNCIFVIELQ